jgi:ATP-binding protein involved in chromosome partitioning
MSNQHFLRSGTGRVPPAQYVIGVGSGKGGVGKSTVSLNLALALAEGGAPVGLLDADLYGPNIPLMVGLTRSTWAGNWTIASRAPQTMLEPMERFGIKVMSVGFLIAEDQPLLLDATIMRFMMDQLIWQVNWGNPRYLVVDLPPGTADIQQMLLKEIGFAGAVLVVTPQDVAHLDGKKAVQQFRKAGVRILGAVENMSGFVCPHCGRQSEVFPQVPDSRSIWSMGIERLGVVPLHPVVSEGGDRGRAVLLSQPDSVLAAMFRAIAARIVAQLQGEQA